MSKIRILHIITRLDRGGSSESTLLTCVGLDKERFEVTVAAGRTVDYDKNLVEEAKSQGIDFIFILDLVRNINLFRDFKALFKIYFLIKKRKFNIVHTHCSKAGFIGRLSAQLAGTSIIIYRPHGHIFYGYFNRFLTKVFMYMEKLAAMYTDRIVTLTEVGTDEWVRFGIAPRDKFTAIHSGVRLNTFKESPVIVVQKKEEIGIPIGVKIVGTVGRLELIKGHRYLIEAIPMIVDEYPNVLFLLIGDGPLKATLQRKVDTLGIREKIKFLGWRDDVPHLLRVMDIFVLPSLNEGMGRTLIEAMVCSLPVVASRVGGIPDVVINRKTGLLVTSAHPPSLARAIVELLRDSERAKIMGEEGKKVAFSRFGFEEEMIKTDELYRNLLNGVSP